MGDDDSSEVDVQIMQRCKEHQLSKHYDNSAWAGKHTACPSKDPNFPNCPGSQQHAKNEFIKDSVCPKCLKTQEDDEQTALDLMKASARKFDVGKYVNVSEGSSLFIGKIKYYDQDQGGKAKVQILDPTYTKQKYIDVDINKLTVPFKYNVVVPDTPGANPIEVYLAPK